jgi:hypothetical protein
MSVTSVFVFLEFALTDDRNLFIDTKYFQLRLSSVLFAVIAFLCCLVTELVIPPPIDATEIYNPILVLTLIPGILFPISLILNTSLGHSNWLWIEYPIIPWLPPIFLGFIFGRMFLNAGRSVKPAYLVTLATSMTGFVCFIIIRCVGKFGNINPPSEGYLHSNFIPEGTISAQVYQIIIFQRVSVF